MKLKIIFGCTIYILLACSVAQKVQKIISIKASISQSDAMPGDNVTLTCEVIGLSKREFIYLYKEVAGPAKPVVENVAINNIFQIPYDISRYTANSIEKTDTIIYKFTFSDAKKEDSGNYQCSSPDNEKNDMVTLTVFEPIKELYFMNHTNSSDVIDFREGEYKPVVCYSNGTTSKPHMSMLLGNADISADFSRRDNLILHCGESQLSGKKCILHSTFVSEMAAVNLRPTYQNDGQILTCKGDFSDTSSDVMTSYTETTSLTVNVTYEPHIECQPEYEVEMDSVNEMVACQVFANPSLNVSTITLSWTEGSKTITLLPDESHDGVKMTLNMESDREHVVSLTFDQVKKPHFHKYTISAENDLGDSDNSFYVKEKVKDPNTGGSTSSGHVAVLSTGLLILGTLFSIY